MAESRRSYRVEFDPGVIHGDVQRVIERTVQLATLRAEQVAKEGAPRDTGALARSITHDLRPTSARIYSPLQYAAVMEGGRRAGARMPPPAALQGWMRRHGMVPRGMRQTPLSLAFSLALMIRARGIKGRFFFRAAAEAIQRELPSILRRAVAELGP